MNDAASRPGRLTRMKLFEARRDGYWTCRIPGLLGAGPAVLATCEARPGAGGDYDDNDLLLRRSVDGGATWSQPRPLARHETYGPGPVSNLVLIDDPPAVHGLFCHDYARVFYLRSDDAGATFTPPVDVTTAFEAFRDDYPWRVVATGPGHGLRLRNGRLIVPVWMSDGTGGEFGPGRRGHRPSAVSVVYSDDRGRTWRRGDIVARTDARVRHPSEGVAVELADGRVLLNVRSESDEHRRLVSVSADGATGWSAPRFEEALREPVCMASMLRLSWPGAGRRGRVLFANPDTLDQTMRAWPAARDRKNLTVRLSYDDGATWPVAKVLEAGPSGYSDLAAAPDGTILCLYECGQGGHMCDTANLTLARFDLAWLTDGADRLEGATAR